jgi:hypothetical protein
MHNATGLSESLWSEIADKIEALQNGIYDYKVILQIGTQY